MYVAYLIPKEDHHLLIEDGIGYIAKGNTEEEAKANVIALYDQDEHEMIERSVAAGYKVEGEPNKWDEWHVLHVNFLGA